MIRKKLIKKIISTAMVIAMAVTLVSPAMAGQTSSVSEQEVTNNENVLSESELLTVVAEQHGDMYGYAHNVLKCNFGTNYQPTGLTAIPGETIIVYVDMEDDKPAPKLLLSQQNGRWNKWGNFVQLKKGKNVIDVTSIYAEGETPDDVAGGPVYIENPYTQEEQGKAPVITFEGGVRHPYLTKDTDIDDFKRQLTNYYNALVKDEAEHSDISERKVVDTFEFVTDRIVFTGTASAAYKVFIENEKDPKTMLDSYYKYMDNIFEYMGLDGSTPNNDPKYVRMNIRVSQSFAGSFMYASASHIGILKSSVEGLLNPFENVGGSWGLTHEIGHSLDVYARTYAENTNNMIPMYTSFLYDTTNKQYKTRLPIDDKTYPNAISDTPMPYDEQDVGQQLTAFWQLEVYHDGYWAELNKYYRDNYPTFSSDSEQAEIDKKQYIVKYSSDVLGIDLTEYFERHGFDITDDTREYMANKGYKKPDKKLWYLNSEAYKYVGDGISKETKPDCTTQIDIENNTVTLNMSVPENEENDLLGYEIYRNGELIAFTSKSTYKDVVADAEEQIEYEVIAYGCDLGISKSLKVHTHMPKLDTDKEINIGLHENFNPLDYVRAEDYEGNVIENINVEGSVDTKKKGTYTLNYSVNSAGIDYSKTLIVNVVGKTDYISDFEWIDESHGWSSDNTPRKDRDIVLLVNGKSREFSKGIGIHADGHVTYDISAGNYDTFEAWVGIDNTIAAQSGSNVIFRVYLDDELSYTSPVMTYYTDAKHIKLDVRGKKTLRIEMDANGLNSYDHTIVADGKLSAKNAVPVLNIPEDSYINAGEEFDYVGKYSAYDAEDGDLTPQTKITANINSKIAGEYIVKYSVTDGDGLKCTKSRSVFVMEEKYTDTFKEKNWSDDDETYAYKAANVNKSIEGNVLSLTDENGESVPFEYGIGAHATSNITMNIEGKGYNYFFAYVGIDHEAYTYNGGSVGFEVYGDDTLLYKSEVMKNTDAMKKVFVDISNIKKLRLSVTNGGDDISADHGDWCGIKFITIPAEKIKGSKSRTKTYGMKSFYLNNTSTYGVPLKYSSSNTKVVKVNKKGRVAITGAGSAVITVKSTNSGVSRKVKIKINKGTQKIKISKSKYLKTTKSRSFTIKAKKSGKKRTSSLRYYSSDKKVLKVNKKTGKVKIVGKGKAKVIIKAKSNKYYKSAQAKVTVIVKK